VSIEFQPGEVHAVLGENGAGKSTLMGVLAGFVLPDSGTVSLDAQPIPLGRAAEVQRLGLAMVHQHFMLVPAFTFAENLALARLHDSGPWLDVNDLARPALQRAADLGWSLQPGQSVRVASVGTQQRLEIIKALSFDAKVLILDEPTAVLAPHEVDELFRVVRGLRNEGRAVILIAHKLDEVMAVADRVTVLRRGQKVGEAPVAQTDRAQITEWMVGELPAPAPARKTPPTEVRLKVTDLTVRGDRGEEAVRRVSFEVRSGEILGIGGVDGNGQKELAEALAGVRNFDGQVTGADSVGYMPQDRHADGLALTMSIRENLIIGTQIPLALPRRADEWVDRIVNKFDVRLGSPRDPIGSLSGGNQQKAIAGRVLSQQPSVVVAMSPTRGLDLKATEYVRTQLVEAAEAGAAVVLISTDLDELAQVADRTLYMSRGALTDRFLEDA
jgi:simple sugar transport system ATP-binding protein